MKRFSGKNEHSVDRSFKIVEVCLFATETPPLFLRVCGFGHEWTEKPLLSVNDVLTVSDVRRYDTCTYIALSPFQS